MELETASETLDINSIFPWWTDRQQCSASVRVIYRLLNGVKRLETLPTVLLYGRMCVESAGTTGFMQPGPGRLKLYRRN
jgi:hypothetical protein